MEDRTESPIAVKVEKHSQYVILTYFQGDINSMVNEHFDRALGKVCKAKAPSAKTKKIPKMIKLGEHSNVTTCPNKTIDSSPINGFILCPMQRTPAPVRELPVTLSQIHRSLLLQDITPSAPQ